MMMLRSGQRLMLIGSLAAMMLVAFAPQSVDADHAWGKYHWDAAGLPVQIEVGDNLSAGWFGHLADALDDWNAAPELNLVLAAGQSNASCAPTFGRIEVCNNHYGDNNWLGLAQIWARGQHILQATTLVNDTYFDLAFYDTWAWRQMVMCQEIAHDFGLDHQDEDFDNENLGTCMDYSADPEAISPFNLQDNTAPNAHDYEQIAEIYAHLGNTGGGGGGGGGGRGNGRFGGQGAFPGLPDQALAHVPIDAPDEWGALVHANARAALFRLDLPDGQHVFTFVIWA